MEWKRSLLHSLFVVPHGFGIGRLYDMYFVFYRSLMQGLTLWHSGSRSGAFLYANEDCCTFSNTEKAADFNILVDFSGFFVLLWRREGDLKISASLETLKNQGRSGVPLPVYPEVYPKEAIICTNYLYDYSYR
ncbi:MAG: hypothetical protein MSS24_01690 [Clostridiales bacterium]|nr:hypothetical protein [Clostridiales bacterium]